MQGEITGKIVKGDDGTDLLQVFEGEALIFEAPADKLEATTIYEIGGDRLALASGTEVNAVVVQRSGSVRIVIAFAELMEPAEVDEFGFDED